MAKLRLRFEKTGRAVYISHLDLMRTFQRAFLRAGLPLKYSDGFNPHAKISILMPLSVGCASLCDLLDFELKDEVPLDVMPALLTEKLPEGIAVTDVYPAEMPLKQMKWLAIKGVFEYDNISPENAVSELTAFFAREELPVSRKTKRGEGVLDLKPHIRSLKFTTHPDGAALEAIISAQEPTINPELLAKVVEQLSPELKPDFASFERQGFYLEDMSEFR